MPQSSISIAHLSTNSKANPSTTFTSVPTPLARRSLPAAKLYPVGFRVGAGVAGIRKNGRKDVALCVSDHVKDTAVGAVFTRNRYAAAPVQIGRSMLAEHAGQKAHPINAVLINAGCANACTGQQGIENAKKSQSIVHKAVERTALIMSTGVIGPQLPMEKLERGILDASQNLGETHQHWSNFSEAIMTTDTVPKLTSTQVELAGGRMFRLAGVSKGAGMIHPNMATMLSLVCTDVGIAPQLLQKAVTYAADRSFNSVSIDGDTSTNDSFAVMANGATGYRITDENSEDYRVFRAALTKTAADLAKRLVLDGEGATKFVAITVANAETPHDARTVANAIGTSALVKCALYGQDANWGRILCATGYSGAEINPEATNLYFVAESDTTEENNEGVRDIKVDQLGRPNSSSVQLVKNGQPLPLDEAKALSLLKEENIYIYVDLCMGSAKTTLWTCDFSYDYVKINADYRS